jgi:hypothetical protein
MQVRHKYIYKTTTTTIIIIIYSLFLLLSSSSLISGYFVTFFLLFIVTKTTPFLSGPVQDISGPPNHKYVWGSYLRVILNGECG